MSEYVTNTATEIVDYLLDNDPPKEFRDAMIKRVEDTLLGFGLATMHSMSIQKELMEAIPNE